VEEVLVAQEVMLNIDLFIIKVGTSSKNEAPSLHMSQKNVICLKEIKSSKVVGDDSEHPCISASDLFPIILRELSAKATVELYAPEDAQHNETEPLVQGRVSYIDVLLIILLHFFTLN
jgi:hypothetical protein